MQHLAARGQIGFLILAVAILANKVPHRRASAQGIEVDVLEAKAWAALDHGDHKAAVRLFELSYDHRPLPSFLYGLARAHDQSGDVQAAYEFYRMYLASIGTEPAKYRLALDRVDELTPLYQLLTRVPAPDVTEYLKPPVQLQWPKCPCPELQKILSPTTSEPKSLTPEELSRGRFQPLTIAAVALGSAGAGAIAAGFGLARLARSEQLAFSRSFDEDFKRRVRARGQSLKVGSITFYATGSVLALASATWLQALLRPLRRAARRDVSLVPWLSPHALGGEISWTF
jgi:hypothetical protein